MRAWSTERPWAILVIKQDFEQSTPDSPTYAVEEIVGPLESLEACNAWITAHPETEAKYVLMCQPLQNPVT